MPTICDRYRLVASRLCGSLSLLGTRVRSALENRWSNDGRNRGRSVISVRRGLFTSPSSQPPSVPMATPPLVLPSSSHVSFLDHPPAGAPSPTLRQRQKRQRRITAGGKAASAVLHAPPEPLPLNNANNHPAAAAAAEPAAATAAQAEADSLEGAWGDYLCVGQPAVWAFLKPTLPGLLLQLMRRHHPADVYPSHYPHTLPPGVPQLTAMKLLHASEAAPGVAGAAAPVLPVLRPAGGPPLPLPVPTQPAQQPEEQPAAAIPRLVPAALPSADPGDDETISSGQADTFSDCGGCSGAVDVQRCWCSECCPPSSCSFTESPDSSRVRLGRRISWRATLRYGDPGEDRVSPAPPPSIVASRGCSSISLSGALVFLRSYPTLWHAKLELFMRQLHCMEAAIRSGCRQTTCCAVI